MFLVNSLGPDGVYMIFVKRVDEWDWTCPECRAYNREKVEKKSWENFKTERESFYLNFQISYREE